jgi:hypothetical protein
VTGRVRCLRVDLQSALGRLRENARPVLRPACDRVAGLGQAGAGNAGVSAASQEERLELNGGVGSPLEEPRRDADRRARCVERAPLPTKRLIATCACRRSASLFFGRVAIGGSKLQPLIAAESGNPDWVPAFAGTSAKCFAGRVVVPCAREKRAAGRDLFVRLCPTRSVGWAERSEAHAGYPPSGMWARRFAPLPTLQSLICCHCEPTGPARSDRPDDKLREAIQFSCASSGLLRRCAPRND